MLPDLTRDWCNLVTLFAELAVQRQNGAAADDLQRVADTELEAVRARTHRGDMLAATFAHRLGLSAEEELAAWTLIAAQLDSTIATRLEGLGATRDIGCAALASVAFARKPAAALQAFAPASALARYQLVELDQSSASWSKRTVVATDRLLSIGLGDRGDEPRGGTFFADARERRPLDEVIVGAGTVESLTQALRSGRCLVQLVGLPNSGRATLLSALADREGIRVLEVDARRLSRDPKVLATEVRLIAREVLLLDRLPLVTYLDAVAEPAIVANVLVPLLHGTAWFTAARPLPALHTTRPLVTVEMAQPTGRQRGALWVRALGCGTERDASRLASRFPLAPGLIVRAAAEAHALAGDATIELAHVAAGVRTVLDDRLGQFAKRVTVTQSWADLVLADDHATTIAELIARIRGRNHVYEDWGFAGKLGKGLGVAALFSGPPGTGKTMVAALIAKELGLELYQVDLGKLVSKWIGETEKQLGELFDAAESGHAVLLFDEADSLLGRRTEVKSSNDRYANLETNYLLQRLESFTGICLFTSNHESNIDPAVHRRLSLHLRFDVPDADERERLWQAVLPPDAPLEQGIAFSSLATRFEMSGGCIRNAALRAAFLAADQGVAIGEAHLEHAARVEYEGMGKIAMTPPQWARRAATS